jgi:hypothetical protein
MGDNADQAARRTVIGGRHGSPTVTVALPFARITNVDPELRDAVADLATLVARLAAHASGGDETEAGLVHDAAEALTARLSATGE